MSKTSYPLDKLPPGIEGCVEVTRTPAEVAWPDGVIYLLHFFAVSFAIGIWTSRLNEGQPFWFTLFEFACFAVLGFVAVVCKPSRTFGEEDGFDFTLHLSFPKALVESVAQSAWQSETPLTLTTETQTPPRLTSETSCT